MKTIRRLFIEDKHTGAIRFTAKGHDYFRKRFAMVGVDIRNVGTIEVFRETYQKWWNEEFVVAAIDNTNPAIDRLFSDFALYKKGVTLRDR